MNNEIPKPFTWAGTKYAIFVHPRKHPYHVIFNMTLGMLMFWYCSLNIASHPLRALLAFFAGFALSALVTVIVALSETRKRSQG